HHLGRELRDAGREVPLADAEPGDSSAAIAARLAADQTGPSSAAVRAEVGDHLHAALDAMDPTDREVLALRHFEGLTNADAIAAARLCARVRPRPAARPPDRLAQSRVRPERGRGAMGVADEPVQQPLGRHVALKVFPPHAARDAGYLARFRREARTAAKLHHT